MEPVSPAAILDAHPRSASEFAELSQMTGTRGCWSADPAPTRRRSVSSSRSSQRPGSVRLPRRHVVAKLSDVASSVIDGRAATPLLGVPSRPRRPEQ